MLMKLIPIVLMAGLAAKGLPMAKDQMTYFQNYAKIAATQQEVSNIVNLLAIETNADGQPPAGDGWINIVRTQVNAHGRDPIVDMWGRYYGYWPGASDFTVGSSGPDGNYNTQDDVLGRYQFAYSSQ